jgi:hypothetical protein
MAIDWASVWTEAWAVGVAAFAADPVAFVSIGISGDCVGSRNLTRNRE